VKRQPSIWESPANGISVLLLVAVLLGIWFLSLAIENQPLQGSQTEVEQTIPHEPQIDNKIRPLIQKYCVDCHGNLTAESGVNL
jgi:hypothetical protein